MDLLKMFYKFIIVFILSHSMNENIFAAEHASKERNPYYVGSSVRFAAELWQKAQKEPVESSIRKTYIQAVKELSALGYVRPELFKEWKEEDQEKAETFQLPIIEEFATTRAEYSLLQKTLREIGRYDPTLVVPDGNELNNTDITNKWLNQGSLLEKKHISQRDVLIQEIIEVYKIQPQEFEKDIRKYISAVVRREHNDAFDHHHGIMNALRKGIISGDPEWGGGGDILSNILLLMPKITQKFGAEHAEKVQQAIDTLREEVKKNSQFQTSIDTLLLPIGEFENKIQDLEGDLKSALQTTFSVVTNVRDGAWKDVVDMNNLTMCPGLEAWTALKRNIEKGEQIKPALIKLDDLEAGHETLKDKLSPLYILILDRFKPQDQYTLINEAVTTWFKKLGATTSRAQFLLEWQLTAYGIEGAKTGQNILNFNLDDEDFHTLMKKANIADFRKGRYEWAGSCFFSMLTYHILHEHNGYTNKDRIYLGGIREPWEESDQGRQHSREILRQTMAGYDYGFRTFVWNVVENPVHWRALVIHIDDASGSLHYTLIDPLHESYRNIISFQEFAQKHGKDFNTYLRKNFSLKYQNMSWDAEKASYPFNETSGFIGKAKQRDGADCGFASGWSAQEILKVGCIPGIVYNNEEPYKNFFQSWVTRIFGWIAKTSIVPIVDRTTA